jgi:hypothetical protein
MTALASAVRLHVLDGAECRMDCTTSGTDDAAPASGDLDIATPHRSRRREYAVVCIQIICSCSVVVKPSLSEDRCWADSMPQSSTMFCIRGEIERSGTSGRPACGNANGFDPGFGGVREGKDATGATLEPFIAPNEGADNAALI